MSPKTVVVEEEVETKGRPWLLYVAVLILAAGLAGYIAGVRSTGDTLHGRASVGGDQASVKVGDWTYGFQLDGVQWRDTAGGWHTGTRPQCLGRVGSTVEIDFGYVKARTPGGGAWREVTWVGCP